ncbi:MAG: NAD(P)-dependent oxidoreductase [Planctomycetia bacterium]|nr:NAD(P)-dependent oxidoreductase [Planctomycetia bacterium]
MSETVLVTGGSGFIGTWVLRALLARGIRAVVFDAHENPARWQRLLGARAAETPFVKGSLLDRALLARLFDEHGITHVIHLAVLLTPSCHDDPFAGCEVNVLGSVALFEQAKRSRVRGLSYASSMAVFGPEPDSDPASSAVVENRSPSFYGTFKKAVELIAEQYWLHSELPSVGIRPHVVYGPERDQGMTAGPSLAARAAAKGESFHINYRGVVGYDFVEDVADAFVRTALETPRGAHVVDLPSEPATVEQLVAAIDAVIPGAAAKITIDGPTLPRNDSCREHVITDILPDWRATSITDGMRRTIEFYSLG